MKEIVAEIVRIRYNTNSNGTDLCWRLLLDGAEYLVNEIDVKVPCITTKDWLADQQVYKHHISIHRCKVLIDEQAKAQVVSADNVL